MNTTVVDGFTYGTTAPERGRTSKALGHYVGLFHDAEAGLTNPVLEDVLARAERAAEERFEDEQAAA